MAVHRLVPARLSPSDSLELMQYDHFVGILTIGGEGCDPCDYYYYCRDVDDGTERRWLAVIPLTDEDLAQINRSRMLCLSLYDQEVPWSLDVPDPD